MAKSLTDTLAALFVNHGVRLVQTADGVNEDADRRLKELTAAIIALLLAANFTDRGEVATLVTTIRQSITDAYAQIAANSTASIAQLAAIEAKFVVSTVNKVTRATTLLTPTLSVTPTVQGFTLQNWWDAQGRDTAFKVVAAIRAGVQNLLEPEQIVAAVQTPLHGAQRNAQSLTHTAVQRIAMDTRNAVMQVNKAVEGIEIVATLDSRTCAQCLAYDGSTYDTDYNPTGDTSLPWNGGPEYHFGCRCITAPILAGQTRSSGLSAQKWLDSKSAQEQDDLLGKGRAALYRKGIVTLRDLVSKTGKQLSLADLSKKYN